MLFIILYHNFILKKVEKYEDCSGKWSSKDTNFSTVYVVQLGLFLYSKELGSHCGDRSDRCLWGIIAVDVLWLSLGICKFYSVPDITL